MSLTVKRLNADSSFLLTFEPLPQHQPFKHSPTSTSQPSQKFTILLDPSLISDSNIHRPKFSLSSHQTPPCLTSLADLPEPDLVIISQSKSNHCHEATLRTLPASGTKTIILAEPSSAKTIRSWRHFEPSNIVTLPPYEAPIRKRTSSRVYTKNITLHRTLLPALAPGGAHGEITVAYVPQRRDLTGRHSAIGITYRPPTSRRPSLTSPTLLAHLPPTPPDSPFLLAAPAPLASPTPSRNILLSPPALPSPSLPPSPRLSASSLFPPIPRPDTLSVLYSPYGISLPSLQAYSTTHLASCAPLTLLLHGFAAVANPWYLGGRIWLGAPSGTAVATALRAKVWVGARGEAGGVGTRERVGRLLSPGSEGIPAKREGSEVLCLGVGEEVRLD